MDQPVKKDIVRPVKPRLVAPEMRIIIFLKEQIIILLSTTQDRKLCRSFERHIQDEHPVLNGPLTERIIGEALQCLAGLHKFGLADAPENKRDRGS